MVTVKSPSLPARISARSTPRFKKPYRRTRTPVLGRLYQFEQRQTRSNPAWSWALHLLFVSSPFHTCVPNISLSIVEVCWTLSMQRKRIPCYAALRKTGSSKQRMDMFFDWVLPVGLFIH